MPATAIPFVTRYLAGELSQFFDLEPGDSAAALSRTLDRPRDRLSAALRTEADRLGAPPQVHAALDLLAQPNSKTVVTGQQPGLLLGPAYTLSKAMSAIALARRLSTDEAPVLPVFWVAAQDHDTHEIDHIHLLDGSERLHRVALELPVGVATGRILWRGEWLEQLGQQLEQLGGRPEYLRDALELLEISAAHAASFADLFSAVLYRLLGDQGLIVLDPTRPAIAPLFAPTLERELVDPLVSVRAVMESAERLREMGLEPQLGRGRDATNLFLDEVEDGLPRRQLLRYDSGVFHTPTRSYTKSELLELLHAEPGRISPAAGLRPVSQDALLPTAAFVVGPGELRYVAQLRGVYRHHDVPMPLVWPRAESVVLEPPVRRILAGYGLDYGRYVAGRETLQQQIVLERHGHAEAFERTLAELREQCEELHRRVAAIDPTLAGTVERGRTRVERTVGLLREKAAAALIRKDEVTSRQFERLECQLFPGGVPQERFLSPFSFFLKFGTGPMMSLYATLGASGEHLLEP